MNERTFSSLNMKCNFSFQFLHKEYPPIRNWNITEPCSKQERGGRKGGGGVLVVFLAGNLETYSSQDECVQCTITVTFHCIYFLEVHQMVQCKSSMTQKKFTTINKSLMHDNYKSKDTINTFLKVRGREELPATAPITSVQTQITKLAHSICDNKRMNFIEFKCNIIRVPTIQIFYLGKISPTSLEV